MNDIQQLYLTLIIAAIIFTVITTIFVILFIKYTTTLINRLDDILVENKLVYESED